VRDQQRISFNDHDTILIGMDRKTQHKINKVQVHLYKTWWDNPRTQSSDLSTRDYQSYSCSILRTERPLLRRTLSVRLKSPGWSPNCWSLLLPHSFPLESKESSMPQKKKYTSKPKKTNKNPKTKTQTKLQPELPECFLSLSLRVWDSPRFANSFFSVNKSLIFLK